MKKFKDKFMEYLKMINADFCEEPTGDMIVLLPAEKIRIKFEYLVDNTKEKEDD